MTTLGQAVLKETDVASAATCDIGAVSTLYVNITGTTGITSFGTRANCWRKIRFAGALVLTNSANLIIPGGTRTTAAGSTADAHSDATGAVWRLYNFQRADGKALIGPASTDITDSGATGRSLLQSATAAAAKGALSLVVADISGAEATANKGAASGYASLDGGGKIPAAQLPNVAISDTFLVASQAAMLALTAERGDVAIRSDLSKAFILSTDSPGTLADWKELLTPADVVQSVAALTGTITAAALRTALSLVIGTDVQAYDAELAALAGLTSAADKVPYYTGSGTAAVATMTAAARTVLDDPTVGDMRNTLGALAVSGNLADLNNIATSRTNLGVAIGTNVQAWDADLDTLAALGNWKIAYTNGSGAQVALALGADATLLAGNGVAAAASFRTLASVGALVAASNLSDLVNAGTARTNLGLAAVAASGSASDVAGTTTNDNAASGKIGEYQTTATSADANANATVTMTIASPCVVTWTAHGFSTGGVTAIKLTTTGALPTGITSGTTYYLKPIDANTFNLATSAANAIAGTFVNTSGTQSGVHTADIRISLVSPTAQDVAAMSLPAGDWDVGSLVLHLCSTSTTVNWLAGGLSLVSNTIDRTNGRRVSNLYANAVLSNNEFVLRAIPTTRFSLATPTTIFLYAQGQFAVSTLQAAGFMKARRVR